MAISKNDVSQISDEEYKKTLPYLIEKINELTDKISEEKNKMLKGELIDRFLIMSERYNERVGEKVFDYREPEPPKARPMPIAVKPQIPMPVARCRPIPVGK